MGGLRERARRGVRGRRLRPAARDRGARDGVRCGRAVRDQRDGGQLRRARAGGARGRRPLDRPPGRAPHGPPLAGRRGVHALHDDARGDHLRPRRADGPTPPARRSTGCSPRSATVTSPATCSSPPTSRRPRSTRRRDPCRPRSTTPTRRRWRGSSTPPARCSSGPARSTGSRCSPGCWPTASAAGRYSPSCSTPVRCPTPPRSGRRAWSTRASSPSSAPTPGAASAEDVRSTVEDAAALIVAGVQFTDLTSGFFTQRITRPRTIELGPRDGERRRRDLLPRRAADARSAPWSRWCASSPHGAGRRRATDAACGPVPAHDDAEPLSQDALWAEVAAVPAGGRRGARRPGHLVLRRVHPPPPERGDLHRPAAVGLDRLHAPGDARGVPGPARLAGDPADRRRRRAADGRRAGHDGARGARAARGRRRQRRLHRRARHPRPRRAVQRHHALGLDGGAGHVRARRRGDGVPRGDGRRAARRR